MQNQIFWNNFSLLPQEIFEQLANGQFENPLDNFIEYINDSFVHVLIEAIQVSYLIQKKIILPTDVHT